MTTILNSTSTLPDVLDAYPGGISGLERDTRATYSTLRRLRLMDHQRTPWKVFRQIAGARGWDDVPQLPQMAALPGANDPSYVRAKLRELRLGALVGYWRRTKEDSQR